MLVEVEVGTVGPVGTVEAEDMVEAEHPQLGASYYTPIMIKHHESNIILDIPT